MRYTKPLVALAALALAVPAAPAGAASLRITFAGQTAPGNTDIYTVAPDGTGRQAITSGPAGDTLPELSPARDFIAFTRDGAGGVRRLFSVRPNGNGVKAIPNTLDGGAPAWSPDGQRIAFDTAHAGGPSGIFTVTPTGAGRTQLTTGAKDRSPDWSPDSKRIVFERGGQIWRMRPDGTQLKKLTGNGRQPAWRPNGKNIAFVRKTNRGGPGKSLAVFLMEPDGSHVTQVTLLGQGPAEKDRRPAWEPNSRHIVFEADAAGQASIRTVLIGGLHQAAPEHVTAGRTPSW